MNFHRISYANFFVVLQGLLELGVVFTLAIKKLPHFLTGTMLVGIGFISAIIVSILDRKGAEQLGATEEIKTESKRAVSYVLLLHHKFITIKFIS